MKNKEFGEVAPYIDYAKEKGMEYGVSYSIPFYV